MNVSERIGFLFGFDFYGWGFWGVLVALTIIDWGIINLIRWRTESLYNFRHPTFASFWLGDSPIGLPLAGASMSVMLHRFGGSDRFYATAWFNLVVLTIGVLISAGMTYAAIVGKRFKTWKEIPFGDVYHAIIFGLMFYLIIAPLIPSLTVVRLDWPLLGLLIGGGSWIGGFGDDARKGKFTKPKTA